MDSEGPTMVKVFLVDDHEVVRRGLIDLLSADEDLEVVGEATATASNCVGTCCRGCRTCGASC
jgi:hypothetical protein